MAATPESIKLWPHQAPGDNGDIGAETDTTTAKDNLVAGKSVVRLGNISNPDITIYRPAKDKGTRAAVVVFPGGGYRILAMDLEGTEVCHWLNSIGVTAVLLKYRVPSVQGSPRQTAPLQDAQRAVGIVRSKTAQWNLDPNRIGVLGFSAGGHLAANLSNNCDKRTYDSIDEADGVSCRPDFTVLIYPAYLTVKDDLDKLAPDLHVTASTPPTFIVQTEDDPVHVENGEVYYHALKVAKVPAEMHLFSSGGHGYGLRASNKTVTTWPRLAEEWFRSQGILQ
jgi:acetyl esterase/lipase